MDGIEGTGSSQSVGHNPECQKVPASCRLFAWLLREPPKLRSARHMLSTGRDPFRDKCQRPRNVYGDRRGHGSAPAPRVRISRPGLSRSACHRASTSRGALRDRCSWPIVYRDRALPLRYRVDFVCYRSVVVEVKAVPEIGRLERMQTVNYLRMAGANRGLLLNFGALSLQYRRVVNTWNGTASESQAP